MTTVRITEYVNIDVENKRWQCVNCGHDLGADAENYKKGCLICARDPREVHHPGVEGQNGFVGFAPDPDWCRIVEFYCPGCGTLMEVEYLPPGHPITHDIKLDLASLKQRFADGKGK